MRASTDSPRSKPVAWWGLWAILLGMPAVALEAPFPFQAQEVTVRTLADAPLHGRLRSFSLEDGLMLEPAEGTAVVKVPADEIVQVLLPERRGEAEPRTPDQPPPYRPAVELQLAGGDRLFGQPASTEGIADSAYDAEMVHFETPLLGTLDIPLSAIERWTNLNRSPPPAIRHPSSDIPHSAFRISQSSQSPVLSPSSVADSLWLSNGDVLSGIVSAVDDRGVTFEAAGVSVTVPHPQVLTVALVPEPLSKGRKVRARVTFVDGSRLTTDVVRSVDGEWSLRLFGHEPQSVRWEQVTRMDLTGGRWVWLTDLEPVTVQHTPMLSFSWPHMENTNVLGGPLRMANRVFERGLGVHSESVLAYDLGGGYRELVTYFGIDDSAGPLADVTAEVHVDDQTRLSQEHVTVGRPWGPVRIDVRGAARLELRVGFGDNAAIQDRFNWADAGLIRERRSED